MIKAEAAGVVVAVVLEVELVDVGAFDEVVDELVEAVAVLDAEPLAAAVLELVLDAPADAAAALVPDGCTWEL